MDGVIGLIIFAVISFVYNKLIEKANGKKGGDKNLEEWLDSAMPAQEVQKQAKTKKSSEKPSHIEPKTKKVETFSTPLKSETHLSKTKPANNLKQAFENKASSQTPEKHKVMTRKSKSRKGLNFKNKSTLRQAFILNTVLSKPKSYEP